MMTGIVGHTDTAVSSTECSTNVQLIVTVIIIIIIIPTYDKQTLILLSVFSYGSSPEQFQAARCPN